MRPFPRGLAAVLILALATSSVAPANAADATVPVARAVIHADRPGPRIDRHIYGQFAEDLGHGIYGGVWVGPDSSIPNIRGFRSDVIEALRELHVPVVRWPGGCFADEYHWRDGIGPRGKRPVTLNSNWGGVPDSNQFGTHEFLDFVGLIGADAYINGNLGTGSPREMSEWLRYMTSDKPITLTAERARNGHPQPWRIAYFGVGNEPWGCGGDMTPQHYADLFRRYAGFLRAPEGRQPTIIAAGGHDDDTTWTQTLVSRIHDHMGAISFHYYTIPSNDWQRKGPAIGFTEDQWISTLAHALRMDGFIARNSAVLDRYDPGKKIAFDVDEWGTWYDPQPGSEPQFLRQQNTLRDALVAALTLDIFQHHADRVRMANIAQMVNVLQAMILTRGRQMLLTPTYHVFRMFRPFQDATFLPDDLSVRRYTVGSVSVPAISLSAARRADGTLAVALVDLDPHRAAPITIEIEGAAPRHARAEVLTAAPMDAHNTFEHPDTVHPVAFAGVTLRARTLSLTLPPKSIIVVQAK